MRQQGFALIMRIQRELHSGHLPTEAWLDGALILAGGIFLLTPGFCTDMIGFTMLLPLTRRIWRRWIKNWMAARLASGQLIIRRF